jgi:spore coat polysaccharide biosynthesis protein SpsF
LCKDFTVTERRVIAIVQARMGSTRLPGKVLLNIEGEPMLAWVVERVSLAMTVDDVVVATTTDPEDDAIVEFCGRRSYALYRGAATDVLDRYWEAAKAHDAEIIVRITADCPLIDPGLIDKTVDALLTKVPMADFSANRLPWERTYPIGLDVEVCTFEALQTAWNEAVEPHQREHVMPYLYEHPERFHILHVKAERDFGDLRWTVDTPDDLRFVREIAKRLPNYIDFSWSDVLRIVNENPELVEINQQVQHKTYKDVG